MDQPGSGQQPNLGDTNPQLFTAREWAQHVGAVESQSSADSLRQPRLHPRWGRITAALTSMTLLLGAGFLGAEKFSGPSEIAAAVGVQHPGATPEATAQAVVDIQPGVIGDAPCGPKIDTVVARQRFEAGQVVVKPSETAAFFDAHPEVETAKTNFYVEHFGQKFIDWVIANKAITQPDVLRQGTQDNSVIRQLMARMQDYVLTKKVAVQNHQCVDGKIVPVQNISGLQVGEQTWSLVFSKADLDAMKKAGIDVPAAAATETPTNPNDSVEEAWIAERLACNNPLLTREQFVQQQTLPTPSASSTSAPSPSHPSGPSPTPPPPPSPTPTPIPSDTPTPVPTPSLLPKTVNSLVPGENADPGTIFPSPDGSPVPDNGQQNPVGGIVAPRPSPSTAPSASPNASPTPRPSETPLNPSQPSGNPTTPPPTQGPPPAG